ncbi:MAG TPA: glycosyl hydrolase, partial [Vicinamibacteria bacterium]|nr:glycosyl hydrolase [Vicinamibacteria bacterium]
MRDDPRVYYFGGTGGGLWKTTDGGIHWANVSDGQIGTGSVGAVAVAASDPNVVYAGMGEGCIRGNVSQGDGVYRSSDAGRTWANVGLRNTRQIGRVRVHPRDPDLVYVAALGHAFGPSADRGVFRSRDGGRSWSKVLFVDDKTGAIDIDIDPTNPRVLYAAFWQVVRTPWSLESGGPGSGLYKTVDGGDTWKKMAGEGLPKGPWGRVGVTVSPANPSRVWALIEAEDGGVYRSDDAGATWKRTNNERRLRQRAWYYTHIFADPKNADSMYVLNTGFYRSQDGGRTFTPIRVPHGDNHDLWIADDDPLRMIESNDGGANVSLDGGRSWSRQDNQPTAQMYHAVTDARFPYFVYGAQQDNSTV